MYWLYIFFSIFGIISRSAYSQVVSTLVTSNFEGEFKSELAVDSRFPICSSQADYSEYSTSPEPEPLTRIFAFLRTGFSILDQANQFTQTQEIKNLVWTDTNGIDNPVMVDEIKEVSCGISVHSLKVSFHLSGESFGLRTGIVIFMTQYSDYYHLAGKTVKGSILNSTTTGALSGLNFAFTDRLRIAGMVRSPNFTILELGTIQNSLILSTFTSNVAGDSVQVTEIAKQVVSQTNQGSNCNQVVLLEKAGLQGLYANGSAAVYLWSVEQGGFVFRGTATPGTPEQRVHWVKCPVGSWRWHQDPSLAQDCYISFQSGPALTPNAFAVTRFSFSSTTSPPVFVEQTSIAAASPDFALLARGTAAVVVVFGLTVPAAPLQVWSLSAATPSRGMPLLLSQSAALAGISASAVVLSASHPSRLLVLPDAAASRSNPGFLILGQSTAECSLQDCAVCDPVGQGCAICSAVGLHKLYLYHQRCFEVGLAPPGVRTEGNQLVRCADPYCTACNLQGTQEVCETCGLDEVGKQRYLDRMALDPKMYCVSTEYVRSTIVGRGINLSTGILSDCSPGCLACSASHVICEKCSETMVLIEKTGNCVQREFVPTVPSTGITNVFPFNYGSCFVTQCQSCPDRSACEDCTPTNLLFPSGICLPEETPLGLDQGNASAGNRSILNCKIADCADCHLDAGACPVCKLGHVLNQAMLPSTCILQSSMVALIGNGNDGLWTKPCLDPQCKDCWADWQHCTMCNPGPNGEVYFVDSKSSTCVQSLPGFGKKAGNTTHLLPCEALGCLECADNITTCNRCVEGLVLFVHPERSPECIPAHTEVPGFGANGTLMVVACQTIGCVQCSEDYLTCDRCFQNGYLYNNTCYLEVQDKTGMNPEKPWILEDCTDPNCMNCAQDYRECTGCDTPTGFYLFEDTDNVSACLTKTKAPPGFGINLISSKFSACGIANCVSCLEDFQTKCGLCKPGYILQQQANPAGAIHSCISTDLVPNTWGWKLNTYEIAPCLDINCLECVGDHRTCKRCAAGYLILMKNFSCVLETSIPDNYGMLGLDQKLVPCSNTTCKNCATDYQSCFECQDGFGLVKGVDPHSTTCVLKASLLSNPWITPRGLSAGFYGVDHSKWPILELTRCQDSSCFNCLENHRICTSCLPNSSSPVLERAYNTCISSNTVPAQGFGFEQRSNPNATSRCSDLGCLECPTFYQACSRCDQASGYFLYELTQDCYTINSLPNRTGLKYVLDFNGQNIAIGTLEPCRDTDCAQCKLNSDICEICDTGYFLDSRTFTCYFGELIPNYVGPKTDLTLGAPSTPGEALLLACSIGACRNCSDFYQRCSECDPGTFLTVDKQSCVSPNAIPPGQGINTALPGTLALCAVVSCTDCAPDSKKCSVCNPGRFYSGSLNTCSPCRMVGCQICDASGDTCLQCVPDFKFYQDNLAGGRTCLASLPDQYGLDLADTTRQRISPCADVGCANCSANFRKCSACSPEYVTQTFTDRVGCLPKIEQATEIPDGFGRDSASNTLKPCSVSRCMSCKTNFQVCEACSTDMVRIPLFRFVSSLGEVKCLFITEIPPGKAIEAVNNTVVPCVDVLCASCLFNKTQCTACLPGSYLNRLTSGELKCVPDTPAQNIPKGYGPTSDEERNVQGLPDYMPCAQKYCKECSLHYTRCSRCALDTFLVSDLVAGLAGKCLKYPTIPPGLSVNSVLQVVPCADPRCKACSKNDPTRCTACLDDQYYFVMPNDIPQTPFNRTSECRLKTWIIPNSIRERSRCRKGQSAVWVLRNPL